MTRRSNLLMLLVVLAAPLLCGCLPEPVDVMGERIAAAQDELMIEAGKERPPAGLTLSAALEYALRNNLSIRAAELEFAIEREMKSSAVLKMLPSLQANIGMTERNKHNASSSMGLRSGEQTLAESFSTERNSRPSDISLVWSIMDFGLSALRARQAEERVRMAEENLRRLRQQIMMETTAAYFRLRAADAILIRCAALEQEIYVQLEYFRDQVADRSLSENEQARRTMPLLAGLKTLNDLAWERQSARVSLAKAMGSARPQDISLAAPDGEWDMPFRKDYDEDVLYEIALASRPEMFRADSETRISRLEAKSALLQLAPNVNFTAGFHNDPNRFLAYHNWLEAGVRVSWDLLRLPSKFKEAKTAEQRAELTALRRKISAASIMVQVNLALLELEQARKKMDYLDAIEVNRQVLIKGVEEAIASGKAHQADALSERILHMSEYASLSWARSDLMSAYARLLSGLGLEPGTANTPRQLARAVDEAMRLATPAVSDLSNPEEGAVGAGTAAAPGRITVRVKVAVVQENGRGTPPTVNN